MLNIMNTTLDISNNSFNKNVKKIEELDFLSIFDTTDSDINEEALLEVMKIMQNIKVEQYNMEVFQDEVENDNLYISEKVTVKNSSLSDLDIMNNLIKLEHKDLNINIEDKLLNHDKLINQSNSGTKDVKNKDDILKFINSQELNTEEQLPSIKINHLNFRDDYKINLQENKDINLLKEIAADENIFITQSVSKNILNVNSNDLDFETKPISVRQEYISKDIVNAITYLKKSDVQSLKLNITPKNLGELTINLTKSSTDTKILITISEQESFNLINKNLKEITQHLETTNIKVNQIVVEVKTDNQSLFGDSLSQQFKDSSNQNQSGKQNKDKREVLEQENDTVSKDENISILA
ncbi:MAG: flagellar hook-length control protein FliK [Peptostreptococcaceae bacterium]